MKHIKPPKLQSYYPDRDIDCQQATEREFQNLVENITAAGWGPAEIAEAIEQLAMADRLARSENGKVDAAIMLANVSRSNTAKP
jgi:hypothetical protein